MTHWCRDIPRDEAVRAAEDGRDRPLPTLAEAIEAVRECRSEQTKGDEMSRGLRTERVTLEITGAPGWKVNVIGVDVESVRVVELEEREVTVGDNEPWQKAILNDAVSIIVDGGDWGRGNSMDHGKLGAAVIWADKEIGRLRSRVAVMEEARKRFDTALEEARDASGINDLIVQRDEAFAERDAAIRERDELRDRLSRCPECNGAGQHDSGGTDAGGEWINLPCDGCGSTGTIHGYVEKTEKLKSGVAELEAASGGGEPLPVAWMVEWTDYAEFYESKFVADGIANGDIVPQPLYRSPPQPRWWPTEEERGSIQHAANLAKASWSYSVAQELENILARSSPPEVVLESWREAAGEVVSIDDVRSALAAIGVAVKEVP